MTLGAACALLLASTLPASAAEGKRIIRKATEPERALLWSDTVKDKDGYHRMVLPAPFVTMLASADKHPMLVKGNCAPIGPYKLIGTVKEGPQRHTWLYGDERQGRMMITVDRFKDNGTIVTLYEDFFNTRIDGAPGVITLATAKGLAQAQWKISATSEAVAVEFYLSDHLNQQGRPTKSKEEVMRLALIALKPLLKSPTMSECQN